MGLVNNTTASAASSGASGPKQISVRGSSYSNLYTVPSGRRFSGHMFSSTSSYTEHARVNGESMYWNGTSHGGNAPITLAEGAVFTSGANTTTLVGVEEDA
jgi:hypothetical protein